MRLALLSAALFAAALTAAPSLHAQPAKPHNVILFVADGLRSGIVTPETAPTMARVRREGVDFRNSHAMYPTVTTANASALATGHWLGDTGNFGNTIYVGYPLAALRGSPIANLENDQVLEEMAAHYPGGNGYLDETTVLAAARKAGYSTASIGKLGPVAIQDLTDRSGRTIVLDDNTGKPNGVPLAPEVTQAITAAGLDPRAPGRGENAKSGTHSANTVQEAWFTDVATRVVLPRFKAAGRPFVMVYWSRDPDGSQHGQGDSPNSLIPGINGPTSLAGIKNADDQLARLLQVLRDQGLADTTDVIVTADHGFSTVAKDSRTSPAARFSYSDTPQGQLPNGFLAIDLAKGLGLALFEPTGAPVDPAKGQHPRRGEALIGADPARPEVVTAPNGGSELIYLPGASARELAGRIVAELWKQDYTAAVFVDDRLGRFPGALPMSAVNLMGAAITPHPAIAVSFRSLSTGCTNPEVCAAEVADTNYLQGGGIHGTLSRADSHNFMAAIGPDFKAGFVDPAPVSNADVGRTLLRLLRLAPPAHGRLLGRVANEALKGGKPVAFRHETLRAKPTADGLATVLNLQIVRADGTEVRYLDAGGVPGRVVGLKP